MTTRNEHIDELFVGKLGNMSVLPPENGWQKIESELNRKSRNSQRFWFAAASIAILLSVTASIVYWQAREKYHIVDIAEIDHNTLVPTIKNLEGLDEISEKDDQNNNGTATIHKDTNPQMASSQGNGESNVAQLPYVSTPDATRSEEILPTTVASNTPVYIDNWNEISKKNQAFKINHLDLLMKKNALTKDQSTDELEPKSSVAAVQAPMYYNMFDNTMDEPVLKRPTNRWEVTGQMAPVYSYRTIASVPDHMKKSDFDQAESGVVTYSGGVRVAYQANRRISIQTGVYYSQMGQSVDNVSTSYNLYATISSNYAYANNYVKTSSGSAVIASNLKSVSNGNYADYFNETQTSMAAARKIEQPSYKLIERIDYLEIPLLVRYKVIDRKFDFYMLGGMSTNFLVGNNIYIDNGDEWIREGALLNARTVNYSGTLGIGISYQIGKNFSVDLEPLFKYYLQSYTSNSDISSNPYAIGVFTGIVYRF